MARATLYLCGENDRLVQTLARKSLPSNPINVVADTIAWSKTLLRKGEQGCLLIAVGKQIETFKVQR